MKAALLSAILALTAAAQQVPLAAGYWSTIDGGGAFVQPHNDGNGALYVDIPQVNPFVPGTDQGAVGYLQTFAFPPLASANTLILSGYIDQQGTQPQYNEALEPGNTCGGDASFGLIITVAVDGNEFDRWWSPVRFSLPVVANNVRSGRFNMQVSLTGLWTSVYGKSSIDYPAQFAAALRNARWIGLTFGGGCFYGHGVNVSGGSARFVITGFTAQ